MSNIVINILAIVGFVILISYLISYIYYYFKKRNEQKIMLQVNPPYQYMQQSGIKCPDYWVNTGVDAKGNYICKNMFNLNVNTKTDRTKIGESAIDTCDGIKCFNNDTEKIVKFSSMDNKSTWEPNNPNGKTSLSDKEKFTFVNNKYTDKTDSNNNTTSRCDWIRCCGAGAIGTGTGATATKSWNTKGVWQGIQSTCSYDPNVVSM